MLPASSFGDGGPPPDPGGTVEVEEQTRARAARVLQHEVAVEQDGFHFRQERIVAVYVCSAGVDHFPFLVGEVVKGGEKKKFGGGGKSGGDGGELALFGLQ